MAAAVELRHLRYFLAVADELHFGRAAESLQLAQPALSQQIRRLETLLGTTLFERTSRSVVLTPAGDALRERARILLRQAARDLEEVGRVGKGEQGRLDVGFVSSAVPHGAIDRIGVFRACYPLVQVRAHEGFSAQLVDRLLDGSLNVATVRDPEEHPAVTRRPIASEPFVAVVPAAGPLPRTAGRDPFVLFPRTAGAHAYEVNVRAATEAGYRPEITQEGSTWSSILHLVGAGLGMTVAPRSATTDPPPTVRVCPLPGSTVRSTLFLARRTDDTRPITDNFYALHLADQPVSS